MFSRPLRECSRIALRSFTLSGLPLRSKFFKPQCRLLSSDQKPSAWQRLTNSMQPNPVSPDDKPDDGKSFSWGFLIGTSVLVIASMVIFEHYTNGFLAKEEADKLSGEPHGSEGLIRRVRQTRQLALDALVGAGVKHAKEDGSVWVYKGYDSSAKAQRYWNDEAAYVLKPEAIDRLRRASHELHSMCLEAVDFVVNSDELLEAFEIPNPLWPAVRKSWTDRQPDLIGRFDFIWDGSGEPKLLEYNADTPTILVEAAVGQKMWLDDVGKASDAASWQLNEIHRRLVSAWPKVLRHHAESAASNNSKKPSLVVAGDPTYAEESENIDYLAKTAREAGIEARVVKINDIHYDQHDHQLVELRKSPNTSSSSSDPSSSASAAATDSATETSQVSIPISHLWKLYPYEWLIFEDIGQALIDPHPVFARESSTDSTQFLEPPWKLILGNKAIIALLWQLYPNHRNLLPASWDLSETNIKIPLRSVTSTASIQASATSAQQWPETTESRWVAKPKFGREGQGIVYSTKFEDGSYALGNPVYAFQSAAETLSMVNVYTDKSSTPSSTYYIGQPVYQQFHSTKRFAGRQTVIGSWMIHGQPAGLAFREDARQTTLDSSSFVPHVVQSGKFQPMPNPLVLNDASDFLKSASEVEREESLIGRPLMTPLQAKFREALYGTKNDPDANPAFAATTSHYRGGGSHYWPLNIRGSPTNGASSSSSTTAGSSSTHHTAGSAGSSSSSSSSTSTTTAAPNKEVIKQRARAFNGRAASRHSSSWGFRQYSAATSKSASGSMGSKASSGAHGGVRASGEFGHAAKAGSGGGGKG